MKPPKYLEKLLGSERAFTAKALIEANKNKMVSSGSVALDWALGGGLPRGELICTWGTEGSGKSTIIMRWVAEEQRRFPQKWAIWIDTEYSFNPERASQLGIDLDRLIILQSNTVQDAIAPLSKMEEDIKANKDVCAIVLDSVKALTSVNELNQMSEGKIESAANAYGGIAKSLNPALNLLARLANECDIMTFLVNQSAANMDMLTSKYQPYKFTGGQKLKHACSTIIFISKVMSKDSKLTDESVKDFSGNAVTVGYKIRGKVNKTRRTVEGKSVEFDFNFANGNFAHKEEELAQLAMSIGVFYRPEDKPGVYFGPVEMGIKARGADEFAKLMTKDKNLYLRVLEECNKTTVHVDTENNEGIIDLEE